MASPETRLHSSHSMERPVVWRSESDRYVTQYRQQGKRISVMTVSLEHISNVVSDGYISFPDYEKFCQSQEYDQYHTADRT